MLSTEQQADVNAALAAAAVLLPPGSTAAMALGLAETLWGAVVTAIGTGTDITDAQLAGMFSADDAAKVADALAVAQISAANAQASQVHVAGMAAPVDVKDFKAGT